MSSEQENNKALARRFLEATARADLDAMDEMMAPEFADRSLMPGQDARPTARSRGKLPPEAYRRALRTLGEEVEALRRVLGASREEVCVAELCFSHGWRGYRRGLSHPARFRCLHVHNHRQRRRDD
jgi:ketosteroid isomerase-like protein